MRKKNLIIIIKDKEREKTATFFFSRLALKSRQRTDITMYDLCLMLNICNEKISTLSAKSILSALPFESPHKIPVTHKKRKTV